MKLLIICMVCSRCARLDLFHSKLCSSLQRTSSPVWGSVHLQDDCKKWDQELRQSKMLHAVMRYMASANFITWLRRQSECDFQSRFICFICAFGDRKGFDQCITMKKKFISLFVIFLLVSLVIFF